MKTQDRTKCVSDGMVYTSMVPQYKCDNCGSFWMCEDKVPECEPKTQDRIIRDVAKKLFNGGWEALESYFYNSKEDDWIEAFIYYFTELKQPEKQEIEIAEELSVLSNDSCDIHQNRNLIIDLQETVNKLLKE